MTCPSSTYVRTALFGVGSGANVDFATFNCHVPRSGSAGWASAIEGRNNSATNAAMRVTWGSTSEWSSAVTARAAAGAAELTTPWETLGWEPEWTGYYVKPPNPPYDLCVTFHDRKRKGGELSLAALELSA